MCGFITLLVEHRTGNAEAMGWNNSLQLLKLQNGVSGIDFQINVNLFQTFQPFISQSNRLSWFF